MPFQPGDIAITQNAHCKCIGDDATVSIIFHIPFNLKEIAMHTRTIGNKCPICKHTLHDHGYIIVPVYQTTLFHPAMPCQLRKIDNDEFAKDKAIYNAKPNLLDTLDELNNLFDKFHKTQIRPIYDFKGAEDN